MEQGLATMVPSARVQVILQRAGAEAERLGAGAIGAEHLLLGLLVEDHGIPSAVIRQFGVDREILRHRVHELIRLPRRRRPAPDGGRPLSKPAARVLRNAEREAVRMHADAVEVEHMLLALVRERSGITGTVLGEAELHLVPVRRQVKWTMARLRVVAHAEPSARA